MGFAGGISHMETHYTGKDITFHFPHELFGLLPLLPPGWIHAHCSGGGRDHDGAGFLLSAFGGGGVSGVGGYL
jgi:hypothetical protein